MSVNAAFWDLLDIKHLTPARKTPKGKQSPRLHVKQQSTGRALCLFIYVELEAAGSSQDKQPATSLRGLQACTAEGYN